MVAIRRIEGIVRAVLVDWVGRVAWIVAVDGIERAVGIVGVGRIERVVRRILVGRVEDVVVPLVALIETHLGMARCDPHAQHRDDQHAVFHGGISWWPSCLPIHRTAPMIPNDCDIRGPFPTSMNTCQISPSNQLLQ